MIAAAFALLFAWFVIAPIVALNSLRIRVMRWVLGKKGPYPANAPKIDKEAGIGDQAEAWLAYRFEEGK